jgi:hypothetical protein
MTLPKSTLEAVIKSGHLQNQDRPLGLKTGQYQQRGIPRKQQYVHRPLAIS